jgi:hypothetical protein
MGSAVSWTVCLLLCAFCIVRASVTDLVYRGPQARAVDSGKETEIQLLTDCLYVLLY